MSAYDDDVGLNGQVTYSLGNPSDTENFFINPLCKLLFLYCVFRTLLSFFIVVESPLKKMYNYSIL